MPIYEFYCERCHAIFQFLARGFTSRQPACPACGRADLPKAPSAFAFTGKAKEPAAGGAEEGAGDLPIDEARMESAMAALASEAESAGDEDDPKQAARLMKRFSDMTGLEMGPTMREAISRLEAGEDPDAIEEKLGPALEEEDPFAGLEGRKKEKTAGRRPLPRRDAKIYDL